MQEYMDSMQHYLGASCEVLKLNNNFLFAGSIHQYDAGEDELTVSIRNGNEHRRGLYTIHLSNCMCRRTSQ